MNTLALVSVVIANWNRRDLVKQCLESLRNQSYSNFEIVLVDNGSSDGSVAFVEQQFPEVRVLALTRNNGFAAANNAGIRIARGELIALLNNDAKPEPSWLESLVHALEAHPEVGFCASKILRTGDDQVIDTAGDVYFYYGVGSKRGIDRVDGPEFSQKEYVFGACAGAAIYRRAMLEDVGLFDEDFFLYMEDIDLSFRAQLRGYRCLFVPEARVYHQVAATAGWGSGLSIYYTRRNILYVLLKNLPTSLLLRHSGPILFYFATSDLVLALSGYVREVARARMDNLGMISRMLTKRRDIQDTRRESDAYVESILSRGQLGTQVRTVLGRLLRGQHLSSLRQTVP
jgi:GT2 family glycosyltransferase